MVLPRKPKTFATCVGPGPEPGRLYRLLPHFISRRHCMNVSVVLVENLGITKAYLESSTTNIYCLNRKNVLHYITINTTCFGFT